MYCFRRAIRHRYNVEVTHTQRISHLLLSAGSLLIMASLSVTSHAAIPTCNETPDAQGTTIEVLRELTFAYDYHHCFSEGLAVVELNDKYGYVNTKGDLVIPLQYASATRFKDGVASVSIIQDNPDSIVPWKNIEKYGFINTQGNWVITPKFDAALNFTNDRAVVGMRNRDSFGSDELIKYGYINKQGEQVIDFKYDEALRFYKKPFNGFADDNQTIIEARVAVKDYWGFTTYYLIDRQGNLTVPIGSEHGVFQFSGGLASTKVDGKFGYINRQGQFVIPAIYKNAYPFRASGDPTAVQNMSGKWGFIDTTGQQVLPFIYYHAYPFDNDGTATITEVKNGRHEQVQINLQGEKVYDQ